MGKKRKGRRHHIPSSQCAHPLTRGWHVHVDCEWVPTKIEFEEAVPGARWRTSWNGFNYEYELFSATEGRQINTGTLTTRNVKWFEEPADTAAGRLEADVPAETPEGRLGRQVRICRLAAESQDQTVISSGTVPRAGSSVEWLRAAEAKYARNTEPRSIPTIRRVFIHAINAENDGQKFVVPLKTDWKVGNLLDVVNKRIQWEWECNELRLAGNNSLLGSDDFCSDVIESEEEIVASACTRQKQPRNTSRSRSQRRSRSTRRRHPRSQSRSTPTLSPSARSVAGSSPTRVSSPDKSLR